MPLHRVQDAALVGADRAERLEGARLRLRHHDLVVPVELGAADRHGAWPAPRSTGAVGPGRAGAALLGRRRRSAPAVRRPRRCRPAPLRAGRVRREAGGSAGMGAPGAGMRRSCDPYLTSRTWSPSAAPCGAAAACPDAGRRRPRLRLAPPASGGAAAFFAAVAATRFCGAGTAASLTASGLRIVAQELARCGWPGSPATCSGVPSATTRPPPLPPSGPMSMTQSAVLMTSRLCSMTITELPLSTSPDSTLISLLMSSKCSPVVGSSST